MADIISFYAAARRFNRLTNAPNSMSGPAQLLFFTGVRYERPDVDILPDMDILMEAQKKPRKRKAAVVPADAALGS